MRITGNPLCPHCHRPSARNGRKPSADGAIQRYRCTRCRCTVRRFPALDRSAIYRRFIREHLWREKVIYAAAVLGVTAKTIVNYRARVRRMETKAA